MASHKARCRDPRDRRRILLHPGSFNFAITSPLVPKQAKMDKFACFLACFRKNFKHLCVLSGIELACLNTSFWSLVASFYRFILFMVNPFWIQFCYFVCVPAVGFVVLKLLKPRTESFSPKNLDMFFMSVSAATISSMSTVEMEVFSNTQLIVLTILMVLGGEVFISMIGLHWLNSTFKKREIQNKVDSVGTDQDISSKIELGLVSLNDHEKRKSDIEESYTINSLVSDYLTLNSIRYLGNVIMGYFLAIHLLGATLISMYLSLVPSARNVLINKGLHIVTFSVFTAVSTFTNCGFIPTNENMMVFIKNPGLLLLLITQALLGNTLYPPFLRFLIWVLGRFTRKVEFNYLLKNFQDVGYRHLLPFLHSCLLVVTVFGFMLVQFILFCCMEWNSSLKGLNPEQKIVAALFQSVNTRHAGELVVDLSIISPAILVLYVIMMYLPPHTTFLPIKNDEQCPRSCERRRRKRGHLVENILFSQLSYLAIFIILICITERKKMKEDPLNFTVLNIVFEVTSAYKNVGLTMGYSCKRQLKPDGYCKDAWYGFSGRWSNEGKLILILAMFFGRLSKFNMKGGKAWKLM